MFDIDKWLLDVVNDAIDNPEDMNQEELAKEVESGVHEISSSVLQHIEIDKSDKLGQWRENRKSIEQEIDRKWCDSINLLEKFIIFVWEIENEFYKHHQEQNVENKHLLNALLRIHANSCRTSFAILKLLKAGFPDEAMAEWRRIYEGSVIASFIENKGENTAKRFFYYKNIADYHLGKSIKEHEDNLEIGIDDSTLMELENGIEELCEEFGDKFNDGGYGYGWANNHFDGNASFRKIEKIIEFTHLHPYYKFSCGKIHLGSRGVQSSLGLDDDRFLPAGPVNSGLSEPAQNTAISLMHVTIPLISVIDKPATTSVLIMIMNGMTDKIKDTFLSVENNSD